MRSLIRVTTCAVMAVVAACGGGGSPTATPAPTPVPDTWLQLWLERGDCQFYQVQNNQCDLVVSTYEQGTSRTVSETNQPAGRYTVYLRNSGQNFEQGSYQVVFTAQAG